MRSLTFLGGAARLAKASREIGMKAVAFDISYHTDPNVFDINSPAGFAFPLPHLLSNCHIPEDTQLELFDG